MATSPLSRRGALTTNIDLNPDTSELDAAKIDEVADIDKRSSDRQRRLASEYYPAVYHQELNARIRRNLTSALGLREGALRSDEIEQTADDLADSGTDPRLIEFAERISEDTSRSYKRAKSIGEELGLNVAEAYLEKQIAIHGGEILVRGDRGNNTLDVVAVIGKRPNLKLVVVEAKGGFPSATPSGKRSRKKPGLGVRKVVEQLGRRPRADTREVDYAEFRQGTRAYLEDLLRMDVELRYKLYNLYPEVFNALSGKSHAGFVPVDYLLVKGDAGDPVKGWAPKAQGWRFRNIVANERDQVRFARLPPALKRSKTALGKRGTNTDPSHNLRHLPNVTEDDKRYRQVLEKFERDRASEAAQERLQQRAAARRTVMRAGGRIGVFSGVAAGALAWQTLSASESNAATVFAASADAMVSSSVEGSDNGFFASVKVTIAEFSRMSTSFTSYVQNGLNELVVLVGGAVSAVSGFVSDIVDSAGVQAVIDKVSDDWAFAQELLNIAMLFSPVGTVAAAISAAVPIIQLIVEHWDQIRAAFDWVLKNVLTPVAEFFMAAFKVYIAPYRLAFDAVMAGFNGMGGVVGTAVGAVRSTVVGIVKAIGQIFQRLEINIGFPVNKSFGLKSVGDAMVAWASERLADGGLVGGQRGVVPRRASGIEVMAVIDRSVLRAAQAEERKIGYAYRPPFLHDGALPRTDNGPGPRTFDVRVADVDAAFAQIRMLQAVQDARFSPVGV
ncbi:hypothetical protein [Nocardia sp. NPDC060249]|uniref:hypothetical protein n=1 Tax=Nocardia sp. NPDC060249 TaxID=3347082 RepID=UPI0036601DFA